MGPHRRSVGERGRYEHGWNVGQERVRPRCPLLSSWTVEVWSWHSKPLRDSGQRKTAPGPWTQRVLAEESALFNPGASGDRTQETLCLLLVGLLGGSPPLCPSWTPSNSTCPPAHALCYLCPPCFLSHLRLLDFRASLMVLDNRCHGGCKVWAGWTFRHHSPLPPQDPGPHLLAQWDQRCQAHPWHPGIPQLLESPEDPSLQVVLKVKS